MMRTTSRPANSPARFVAARWASLKYAGTVMTAFETALPIRHSAMRFSSLRISALTSSGLLPDARRAGSWIASAPIQRFTLLMTRIESAALRLSALRPTSTFPSSPNQTTLGVIRFPSSSASRMGKPESTTPTAEWVVPRSIPRIIPLVSGGAEITYGTRKILPFEGSFASWPERKPSTSITL